MMLLRLLLILCLGLSACAEHDPVHHYFPLDAGRSWTYLVTEEKFSGQRESTLTISNLGRSEFNNQSVYVRHSSDGTDYLITDSTDGLARVAKRLIVENRATADPQPRRILPAEASLQLNQQWAVPTTAFALYRVHPYEEPAGRDGVYIEMNYRVAGLDATVETEAGRFDHCLLLEANGQLSIYADPKTGYQDIEIINREWYAPGIGLVKQEREERLDTEVFKGGKVTLSLRHYQ